MVENSTALSFEYKIEDLPSGEDLDGHVSSVQTYAEGSDEFYGCYYESENVIFGEPAFYPGTYGASPPNSIKVEPAHAQEGVRRLCLPNA